MWLFLMRPFSGDVISHHAHTALYTLAPSPPQKWIQRMKCPDGRHRLSIECDTGKHQRVGEFIFTLQRWKNLGMLRGRGVLPLNGGRIWSHRIKGSRRLERSKGASGSIERLVEESGKGLKLTGIGTFSMDSVKPMRSMSMGLSQPPLCVVYVRMRIHVQAYVHVGARLYVWCMYAFATVCRCMCMGKQEYVCVVYVSMSIRVQVYVHMEARVCVCVYVWYMCA